MRKGSETASKVETARLCLGHPLSINMMDLGSFSATVEKLQHDATLLDRQLANEDAIARDLQLSALNSARRQEVVEKEVQVLIGQICELEMEIEDLACLNPQEEIDASSQQRVIHSEDHHAV